jgi:hypothetical protein
MAHHDAVLPAVTMHWYAEGVNSSRPSPEAIFADAAVFAARSRYSTASTNRRLSAAVIPTEPLPTWQEILGPVPLVVTQSVAAHRSAPQKLTADESKN